MSDDRKQRRWEMLRKLDTSGDYKNMVTGRLLAHGISDAVTVIGESLESDEKTETKEPNEP